MAVSRHADTPSSTRIGHNRSATPYTTLVDMNHGGRALQAKGSQVRPVSTLRVDRKRVAGVAAAAPSVAGVDEGLSAGINGRWRSARMASRYSAAERHCRPVPATPGKPD